MQIDLKFFASVREALGVDAQTVDVPEAVRTVGDLRAWLRARGSPWSEALAQERALRVACDHVMVDAAAPVADGAEIAFFPPVTGG